MRDTAGKYGVILALFLTVLFVVGVRQVLLYLMILYGLLQTDVVHAALPLPLWALHFTGILSLLSLVFLIFIAVWKKLAFYAFVGVEVIAFIINIYLGVELHLFGLLSPFILYLLLRPKWHLLD